MLAKLLPASQAQKGSMVPQLLLKARAVKVVVGRCRFAQAHDCIWKW